MNDINFIPTKKQDIITQEVDGETLILNNQGTEIHQLNDVASLIWIHCDGSYSIDSISQILLRHYTVSQEQAIKDVTETIAQFMEKGLLE